MATTWTLGRIRQKVRQVTGRFGTDELSNSDVDRYINNYYQYTFPAEVKLDKEHVYYEFLTTPNQAYYDQPLTQYTNFQPPATANNLGMVWYQSPGLFIQQNTNQNGLQYNFLTPWTGDGVTTTFSTTVTGYPILPGSVTVESLMSNDVVETFQDTNQDWSYADVVVTGSPGGTMTLNYNAGTVDVTFSIAPADGANINLNYIVFNATRPQAILMYNNQFQLWPIPDQVYVIRMQAYQIVQPLESSTDTPGLNEWGPCIAYGASRDISADYGEMDAYATITALYKEQVDYIMRRTHQNLLNTRAAPKF